MVSADGTILVARWPAEPEGGIEVKLRNSNFQKHAETYEAEEELRGEAPADTS